MGGFTTIGLRGGLYDYVNTAGTDIFAADDETVTITNYPDYGKTKEMTYVSGDATNLKIYFELSSDNFACIVYGRIYKNGVAYGTEWSTTSTSWVGFSEVLSFYPGDKIQLYTKLANAGGAYKLLGWARYFRVLGTKQWRSIDDLEEKFTVP
jgi:hypothetical protein